jgi:fimbrial chaperone protein
MAAAARHAAFALALALASGLGGRARAGDLEVNPVRVALSRGARSAVVAVRNAGTEATRLEVRIYAWEQSPSGEMKLTPTEEVVAFPPLLQLGPGERRNVRVGAKVEPGAAEKAYRLFVEEMPPPAAR